MILSKKTFATVGEVLLGAQCDHLFVGAFSLGIEPALYSVLTYLAATKTIDFLLHGIEAYQGMLIVSVHKEAIRQAILNELGRGVTPSKPPAVILHRARRPILRRDPVGGFPPREHRKVEG